MYQFTIKYIATQSPLTVQDESSQLILTTRGLPTSNEIVVDRSRAQRAQHGELVSCSLEANYKIPQGASFWRVAVMRTIGTIICYTLHFLPSLPSPSLSQIIFRGLIILSGCTSGSLIYLVPSASCLGICILQSPRICAEFRSE